MHRDHRACRDEPVSYTHLILEQEKKGAKIEEIIPLLAGQRSLKAWQTGDVEDAPLMVGQSIGLIKEITTCAELLQSMVNDARAILEKNLSQFEN